MKHRAKLILKPNDDTPDQHSFRGSETDDIGWEKRCDRQCCTPYVVQEIADPAKVVFPLMQYGSLMMKEMQVDVHPHSFYGKVHGCSSWLSIAGSQKFFDAHRSRSYFVLEGKNSDPTGPALFSCCLKS